MNRLSRVHERYRQTTDRQTDRQTDRRQTDGRQHIANVNAIFKFYLQSTLNCSVTSSGHAYLRRSALCSMREVVSYGRRRRVFLGKNCSPCAGVTGQGNHFEFIPTVSMESQHSTGGPTCHKFPRFVIISEKSRPEVGNC